MDKLQRTAEILKAEAMGGGPPELSDLALRTRASIRGDSDPWPRDELERVLEAFRFRLEVWEWKDDPIDIAVRSMVLEGVRLIVKELEDRINVGWTY